LPVRLDQPGADESECGLAANHDAKLNHCWESKMPESTYKIVEIVGTSEVSISKAIEGAIAKASGSLRHLGWFEVGQIRGNIADGKVNRYQVTLKVGFTLE
jgi:flavin-binding protein dodecin